MMIVEAKSENKSWLINLDDETASEIDTTMLIELEARLSEADRPMIVEARAYAASHSWSDA